MHVILIYIYYTDKLSGSALVGLFFVAVAHALAAAVMISAGFRISGGHLNPAVTIGLLTGGNITLVRSILYWIDQLLASVAACALLSYTTGGLVSGPIIIAIFIFIIIQIHKYNEILIFMCYFLLFSISSWKSWLF